MMEKDKQQYAMSQVIDATRNWFFRERKENGAGKLEINIPLHTLRMSK
jgi:hypothetical protein